MTRAEREETFLNSTFYLEQKPRDYPAALHQDVHRRSSAIIFASGWIRAFPDWSFCAF
jgi:hypothetical protein